MTQSANRAPVLTMLASEHNRVALAHVAVSNHVMSHTAGGNAVRFAKRGMTVAQSPEVQREAALQYVIGKVWTGEPVDAVKVFRATDPRARDLRRAVNSLSSMADVLAQMSVVGGPQIERLHQVMSALSVASLDVALRKHGVPDGLARRHELVLGIFQRDDSGLFKSFSEAEIGPVCKAFGLRRSATSRALAELKAAKLLESHKRGNNPRYTLSLPCRQVLQHVAPKVRAAQQVSA
jgi:DNA-binding transcriptional ArsR family regulator